MISLVWDGQKVASPGLYRGIPLHAYHGDLCAGPSVSSSMLRLIWDKSAAHCWAKSYLNPKREIDPTVAEAQIMGSATHHLICGEVGFANQFAIQPETIGGEKWHASRKVCKAWKATRKREGKSILTTAMVENIKGMAQSLSLHPLILAGALNGQIERSIVWHDRETDLWCKARPDAMPNDSGDFSDIKTTRSVLYRDLQKSLGDYGYCMQAAMVMEGARALDMPTSSFSLIWIEKTAPFCVRVQTLRDEDIERGRKMNRVAMRTYADCLASGSWPGPGDDRADAEYIDLPDWKRKQIDERLHLQLREAA